MMCLGIIWNCALQFQDDIIELISHNCQVINDFTLDLSGSYDKFVRELYLKDSIDEWKINKKLEFMNKNTNLSKIRIIIFDIKSEEKFYNTYKRTFVLSKLELLKSIIRMSCMSKINYYFFDIIFHCSDNQNEFENDYKIIEKYLKNVEE